MTMTPGNLYKSPDFSLLILPSKEKAHEAESITSDGGTPAMAYLPGGGIPTINALWWSKHLNCKVRHSELNETFMCLERVLVQGKERPLFHVLFGETEGWIVCLDNWAGIEKVVNPS